MMRQSRAITLWTCLIVATGGEAVAQVRIVSSAQVATTQDVWGQPDARRFWTVGTENHLYTKLQDTSSWLDVNSPAGTFVASFGPAATSFQTASDVAEQVFVIDTAGHNFFQEYFRSLVSPATWCAAPAGPVSCGFFGCSNIPLTGPIAAATFLSGSVFETDVAAVDQNGRLNIWTKQESSGGCGGFTYRGAFGSGLKTSGQVVGINQGGTTLFYAQTAANGVAVLFGSLASWTFNNLGAPSGVTFTDTHLAAAVWLTSVSSFQFDPVFAIGSDGQLWENGWSLRWNVANGWVSRGSIPAAYSGSNQKTLTATSWRATSATEDSIEVTIGGNYASTLSFLVYQGNSGWLPWVTTGTYPDGRLQSITAFASSDGSIRRWYGSSIISDGTAGVRFTFVPLIGGGRTGVWDFQGWFWAQQGSSNLSRFVYPSVSPGVGEFSMAESPTSGKILAAAITLGSSAVHVQASFSSDDGATWSAPTQIQEPPAAHVSINGDMIVDYDGSGTAFVSSVAGDVNICSDSWCAFSSQVQFVSTTDGVHYTQPIVVASASNGTCDRQNLLDHAWMTIHRSSGTKHFVWKPGSANDVFHRAEHGCSQGCFDPVDVLHVPGSAVMGTNVEVPMAAVDRDGTLFVLYHTDQRQTVLQDYHTAHANVCRFDPGTKTCVGAWTSPDLYYFPGSIIGATRDIDGLGQYHIVASPSFSGVVYVVMQGNEYNSYNNCWYTPGPRRTDIYLAKLAVGGDGSLAIVGDVNPIRVNTNTAGDCTDQFNPSVTATTDGLVYVSWYDRREPEGGINHYFAPYMAVFKDSSSTGTLTRVTPSDIRLSGPSGSAVTDPDLLPAKCFEPDQAFVGDYQVTLGGNLHSHVFQSTLYPGTSFSNASQWTVGANFYGR